jgi:hypothetical protein
VLEHRFEPAPRSFHPARRPRFFARQYGMFVPRRRRRQTSMPSRFRSITSSTTMSSGCSQAMRSASSPSAATKIAYPSKRRPQLTTLRRDRHRPPELSACAAPRIRLPLIERHYHCQPSFIVMSAFSARVALFHAPDISLGADGYFNQNAEIILLHIQEQHAWRMTMNSTVPPEQPSSGNARFGYATDVRRPCLAE